MDKQQIINQIEDINKQIGVKNQEIVSLREQGIKLIGKLELLDEQEKSAKVIDDIKESTTL